MSTETIIKSFADFLSGYKNISEVTKERPKFYSPEDHGPYLAKDVRNSIGRGKSRKQFSDYVRADKDWKDWLSAESPGGQAWIIDYAYDLYKTM